MGVEAYDEPLRRAQRHAMRWLDHVDRGEVVPRADVEAVAARIPAQVPEGPTPAADVVDLLAEVTRGGLTAMPSGRFFGFVIGGSQPAALAADWLVSAWDQNAALRFATPATAAVEEAAGRWLLQLLGLPDGSDVGFVTGATTANFVALAAARSAVLARAGWDVEERGLTGAPRVHVLVGAERHDTVDLALRYLGLGRPVAVAADDQGRLDPAALEHALDAVPAGAPLVVVLQAGNVHSGAFDPFARAVPAVHARGGWVHVDGAFGLWAAAAQRLRPLMAGAADADSWATDAHKTLNVPYDSGVVVVRDRAALRAAMSMHGSYLVPDVTGVGDPHDKVPELSRRARGVPVWAALTALGRSGVDALVDRLAARAHQLAEALRDEPGVEVLNDVPFTQVCLAFGDDDRTRAVTRHVLAEGAVWLSGSTWRGRAVLRASVSNWSTTPEDVDAAVSAVRRAVAALP